MKCRGKRISLSRQDVGRVKKAMKVLFVCYASVGRSQVAEAAFRARSRHDCSSAGIAANERVAQLPLPSRKLKHAAIQHSIKYIRRSWASMSVRSRGNSFSQK